MAGHIALVTGAARGIGREITAGLSALGMTVLMGVRDPAAGAETAAKLRAEAAGELHVVRLDVTEEDSALEAAAEIERRFGRLDVLVNNAGVAGDVPSQMPGTADLDTVRGVFETNVFGALTVTEAMLPVLRRAASARIVNMSSSVGSLALMSDPDHYFAQLPALLAYAPSKTALNQLTVQYAKQLRAEGILVNAADPGACATDFTAAVSGLTRTAADGAAIAIRLATLDASGPTGGIFADADRVPW